MPCTPDRCPLCGQANECQLATQDAYKGPCWCMDETFPPELLARIPEEARGCACICQHCVADVQEGKNSHARRKDA